MEAILEKLWDFLQQPFVWKVVAAWIAERFEALSRDKKKIIRTLVGAVDEGEKYPNAPRTAKNTIKASPEGDEVALLKALDDVSPLIGEKAKKRISKARAIGNVLFNCIPFLSRARGLFRRN